MVTTNQAKDLIEAHIETTNIIEVPLINFELVLKQENMALLFINHVFTNLSMLSEQYPDFRNWLEKKVFTGLYDGTRSILLEWRDGKIAGLAILKNEIEEKKLCCLRIMPEFQNKGIGIKLFQRSFAELGTEKPLLSALGKSRYTLEACAKPNNRGI